MIKASRRNVGLLLFALILVCGGISIAGKWPSTVIAPPGPTATQEPVSLDGAACIEKMWITYELPELEAVLKTRLEQTGLEVADVSVMGEGETRECTVQTRNGPYDFELMPSSAASTRVATTLRVQDTSDDTTLGESVLKVVRVMQTMRFDQPVSSVPVSLTFQAPTASKQLDFSPGDVQHWREQGLSSAVLMAILDRRASPPPDSTPTP